MRSRTKMFESRSEKFNKLLSKRQEGDETAGIYAKPTGVILAATSLAALKSTSPTRRYLFGRRSEQAQTGVQETMECISRIFIQNKRA